MEAEVGAVVGLGERELELVAVAVDLVGRDGRLHGRVGDVAEAPQRLAHLVDLRLELRLVREILEPAAATLTEVRAARLDAARARLQQLRAERLGVALLDLRHLGAHEIARQAALHEDDEAVPARDTVAAVGERVDAELELLSLGYRRAHDWPGYLRGPIRLDIEHTFV